MRAGRYHRTGCNPCPIEIKTINTLRRVKQHSWPSYARKAELAATLSLQGPRLSRRASLKMVILFTAVYQPGGGLWTVNTTFGKDILPTRPGTGSSPCKSRTYRRFNGKVKLCFPAPTGLTLDESPLPPVSKDLWNTPAGTSTPQRLRPTGTATLCWCSTPPRPILMWAFTSPAVITPPHSTRCSLSYRL